MSDANHTNRTRGKRRDLLGRILQSFGADGDRRRAAAASVIARCHALLSERGEASGRLGAIETIAAYRALDEPSRTEFFLGLLNEFSPDRTALDRAIASYQATPSHASVSILEAAAEPPRQELFRRFNMAPGGTQALLDLRRDLTRTLAAHPELGVVDADLARIFRSWFNRGFLNLQRIDWRTSALVLERLIQYEAVHQIASWRDLRRRLESDRRCYAFFHPALPDEPLIFIEIALTRGMSATIQPLIDPDSPIVDPATADAAMFYSITSCQDGLRGISFGNFLIKQVVEELKGEFRRINTFATLSPIPQFRQWLESAPMSPERPTMSSELAEFIERLRAGAVVDLDSMSPALNRQLFVQCAWYLMCAKRDRTPLDSVARFHLANGARLERLNWRGDVSETGLRRSFGLTVNYVYELSELEHNHERYARDASVMVSRPFSRVLRQAARRP
jgi:malonyl-CoA decarboxylase